MKKIFMYFPVAFLLAVIVSFSWAMSQPEENKESVELVAVEKKLDKNTFLGRVEANQFIPIELIDIAEPSEVPNIWRVQLSDGRILYVSDQGNAIFSGELWMLNDAGDMQSMNKAFIGRLYGQELKAVKPPFTIDYKAQDEERALIYVFTDINCGYCQRFHQHIPEMQAAGITVRYIPLPVIRPESQKQMTDVWCSAKPANALTEAKLHGKLPSETEGCSDKLVQKGLDLGTKMGLRGTPAVFNAEGQQIGSYMTTQQLLEKLGLEP